MPYGVFELLLVGLLATAVVSDFRRHRISNLLVLVGLVVGFLSQLLLKGGNGLGDSLLGILVGFGFFLPLYSQGGMSAGDVKLMAMVGAFLGAAAALLAAALSLVVGGGLGIIILLRKKQALRLVQRYWAMLALRTYIVSQPDDAANERFPFAVAIAVGTLISLIWQPFGP